MTPINISLTWVNHAKYIIILTKSRARPLYSFMNKGLVHDIIIICERSQHKCTRMALKVCPEIIPTRISDMDYIQQMMRPSATLGVGHVSAISEAPGGLDWGAYQKYPRSSGLGRQGVSLGCIL